MTDSADAGPVQGGLSEQEKRDNVVRLAFGGRAEDLDTFCRAIDEIVPPGTIDERQAARVTFRLLTYNDNAQDERECKSGSHRTTREEAAMKLSTASRGLVAALVLSIPVVTTAETLLEKLLRVAGLTAGPAPTRSTTAAAVPGNIWVATTDTSAAKALTTDGGYTSPIISPDGRVYALRGGAVVRLPQETGAGVAVHQVRGALKLVGFDVKNPDDLVVLLEVSGAASPLGVLSLTSGRVTPLPYDAASEEQRRMVARIRSDERQYGTTGVYTNAESRRGPSRSLRWTDVYVRKGAAAARNVSKCDGASCGQPALSPDGRRVVFVKSAR